MRILIANDDGIGAPGLAFLERSAAALGGEIWTVAPDAKRTAAGASITIGRPLTLRRLGERRYACSGTPADCVVAAMCWLFEVDPRPDLVLAGVNDGRNVAEDLAYSGTLGIAREASFWGVPAIGFSRVKDARAGDGDSGWVGRLLTTLWERRGDWALDGHWLSVNLPAGLPAAVAQPEIGHDKIANRAEVVSQEGAVTVLNVPRGRPHSTSGGDENALIDAGYATINRLGWRAQTPLPERFVSALCR